MQNILFIGVLLKHIWALKGTNECTFLPDELIGLPQ